MPIVSLKPDFEKNSTQRLILIYNQGNSKMSMSIECPKQVSSKMASKTCHSSVHQRNSGTAQLNGESFAPRKAKCTLKGAGESTPERSAIPRHLATANGRIKRTGARAGERETELLVLECHTLHSDHISTESLVAWGCARCTNCKYSWYLCASVLVTRFPSHARTYVTSLSLSLSSLSRSHSGD